MTRRLMIVSDSPAVQSGLGRVVRELAARFHEDKVDVLVAGWWHAQAKPTAFPYKVAGLANPGDSPAALIDAFVPDTVLAIGDVWSFRPLAQLKANGGAFRLVGYLNVEAVPVPPAHEALLDAFDVLTTTSQYGAKVIDRPGVVPIHHGVDRQVFRPLEGRKITLAGRDLSDPSKTFVVLLNGQNTERKNFPVALDAFARFSRGKGDVMCYANTQLRPGTAPWDPPGHDLADVVVQHGIQPLVVFAERNHGPLDTVDDENMNSAYAIATVLLNTSFSEGFALPILESLATRTVPIAPNDFSATELLANGRGVLVPIAARIRSVHGTDVSVVSADEVAGALELLYAEWRDGALERRHQEGLRFAMSRSWDRTYRLLTDAMEMPAITRAADGNAIDPYLRTRARRASGGAGIALVKMGGLGEMLQATAVAQAAYQKWGQKITAFVNSHEEVLKALPCVETVIKVTGDQDVVVRSVADQFSVCLDVRIVSKAYGVDEEEYEKHRRWFREMWPESCARLGDLDEHSTVIMLRSLGLTSGSLTPIFTPREGGPALDDISYVCVSAGNAAQGNLHQWPQARWTDLAAELELLGFVAVQIGDEIDMPIPGAMDNRGVSLARTAAALEGARGFVGVDNGYQHLATAVGTPSVVLFGPTDPQLFGYPQNANLAPTGWRCHPCWGSFPAWANQVCTRGEAVCVNFPDVPDVLDVLQKLVQVEAVVA